MRQWNLNAPKFFFLKIFRIPISNNNYMFQTNHKIF